MAADFLTSYKNHMSFRRTAIFIFFAAILAIMAVPLLVQLFRIGQLAPEIPYPLHAGANEEQTQFVLHYRNYFTLSGRGVFYVVHIFFGALALLFSFVQIAFPLPAPKHRLLGIAIIGSIACSATAGMILSFSAFGGPIAKIGFFALSVAWLYTVTKGWKLAKQKEFIAHRKWMLRAFALTLAGITLRAENLILQEITSSPILWSQIQAWLCWLPNLLLLEGYFWVEKNLGKRN